ncbi:sulfite exporter TauE/SafE family protein [Methanobrevibacter sp. TMH8]|uniref:sulfite exporter TauE/SafE family protein n=1 Tax=Methanobrevibacter sp. TMH8 TaxID=2848611 RepID=UPI001CCDFBDB|nr:sulfite exporter TauE/SafE family protein [Methanobrevibacter sp. TMH8]MBZ9571101.1 sulfite exporter TauE/SafE family protein [Methanobrevibacter sp. TMH8]
MFDFNLIFIPLFGFLVGFLVSTLGGGGGGFYVPILTLVFGVPPHIAVATSLASVLPTTAAGAFSHYREGNVNIRLGLILGIGGIFGTLIGTYIANLIPSLLLEKILGIFVLIMLIPMLKSFIQRYKEQKEREKEREKEKSNENIEDMENTYNIENTEKIVEINGFKKVIASFFGFAGGILAGIFGISGTPPVTAGLYSLGLPAIMVVGTTIFVLIFNSLAGIGGYFVLGKLDIPLILLLSSGSIIGAFLGPKSLKKIDPKIIEKVYGPILISISLVMGLGLLLA